MSFIRTGIREIGLKIRRQRTRLALRHQKRVLQKSEIALGREGCSQAVNFPEVRQEIVALKKLEQEQKEVASRIAQIEEGIKRIDAQRQQNAREQTDALAKLEEEKKPLLANRNQAKATADLCDRELASVEKRLQDNDDADRELMRKLAELQAQVPPPADLEAQTSVIGSQRGRLPNERAEITRARLGSAEACRSAKEKLTQTETALEVVDKKIATTRAEFEERDRAVNETSRAQQEALKDARGQHQTVEERKNPAYLNIGRHLASQGIAPPNAPHLLPEVQRHRAAVEQHSEHAAQLATLSSQIDKQELRKFYFSVASVIVLAIIVVAVVFQTPQKREWLPQETGTILSLNTDSFEREDLPKRWRKDQATDWQNVWNGLTNGAQQTPGLNLQRDVVRITRAVSTSQTDSPREFTLVESRSDLAPVIRAVNKDKQFQREPFNGLPVWIRPNFAIARVGANTLAVGPQSEVEELVQVRLGINADLKITGTLFDRFQALDQSSAFRLISRDPPKLSKIFQPVFSSELLESAQIFGLSLSLQTPAKARMTLKLNSSASASDLAQKLRKDPQRFLRVEETDSLLYIQPPQVDVKGTDVELRFDVPENSARALLERVAKTNGAAAVAGN